MKGIYALATLLWLAVGFGASYVIEQQRVNARMRAASSRVQKLFEALDADPNPRPFEYRCIKIDGEWVLMAPN
jgi:hypothetical protein